MKKLTAILVLVIVAIMFSPGYADIVSFNEFVKATEEQKRVSGRSQVSVETATCIIVLFGLEKVMKKLTFNKTTGAYKTEEIKKFDDTQSEFDQTPQQRLQEALVIYGHGQQTE